MNRNKITSSENPDMCLHDIYTIHTDVPFTFIGKYRRDLETNEWHYYEDECHKIWGFRKEHMVAVIGPTPESIIKDILTRPAIPIR